MQQEWGGDARAVEIAGDLARLYGATALDHAQERRHEAVAAGRVGRADLYQAVCTVLADRDGVITRWRARVGRPDNAALSRD